MEWSVKVGSTYLHTYIHTYTELARKILGHSKSTVECSFRRQIHAEASSLPREGGDDHGQHERCQDERVYTVCLVRGLSRGCGGASAVCLNAGTAAIKTRAVLGARVDELQNAGFATAGDCYLSI